MSDRIMHVSNVADWERLHAKEHLLSRIQAAVESARIAAEDDLNGALREIEHSLEELRDCHIADVPQAPDHEGNGHDAHGKRLEREA